MKIGTHVRITSPSDRRDGEVGTITYISRDGKTALVRFDDGAQLGYLIDDNEIKEVTE